MYVRVAGHAGNNMGDPREVGTTNNKETSFISYLRHV